MFVYKNTPSFSVLEYKPHDLHTVPPYVEESSSVIGGLLSNGCYHCGPGFLAADSVSRAYAAMSGLVAHLVSIYDGNADEFVGFDKEEWNVVRTPRINPGKHNIHFDPYMSEQHFALDGMAQCAAVTDLLTDCQTRQNCESDDESSQCKVTSLRETGLSLTAPRHIVNSSAGTMRSGGAASAHRDEMRTFENGMELHSDGPRGENTVLMSFENISFDQGPLLLAPGTHNDYIDGTGHRPEHVAAVEQSIFCRGQNSNRQVYHYCYKAAEPIIIDSRTMHGALPNISRQWRVICWFIFEYV